MSSGRASMGALTSGPPGEAATQLSGRWLVFARAFFGAVALYSLALYAGGVPERLDELRVGAEELRRPLHDLGISPGFYTQYFLGLDLAIVLAHLLIAAVIVWRKSDDWMAVLVALVLVTAPMSTIGALESVQVAWQWPISIVNYLGIVSSLALLYLFPDGWFVPRWTRYLLVVWAAFSVYAIFLPGAPFSLGTWSGPLKASYLLAWSATGIYAQVYRYLRVSSQVQRQQTRWAVLGLAAVVLGPFSYFLLSFSLPSVSQTSLPNLLYQLAGRTLLTISLFYRLISSTLFTLFVLLFPLSFAIAILRYRLWDIEVLINRTLVYSVLTGVLVLVYVASVALFSIGLDFLPLGGSNLALVFSTLAIAALFQPVRRRVQDLIDRRFYRRKYDAARTLAAFSARMRDEVDLDKLTGELLEVVRETMQPTHASLWLRREPER